MVLAVITFILWSPTEFTARAETNLTNYHIINILESTVGSRFDFNLNKWFFTLQCHDSLATTLTYIGCVVNLLPRHLIAALQVQAKVPIESSTLTQMCAPSVLNQLAQFQKEGVEFVISKNGRAIIADEMGLGKTRSAIACAVCYRDDWPVIIVSPSSARYHWYAELTQILCPEIISRKDILVVESAASLIHRLTKKDNSSSSGASSSSSDDAADVGNGGGGSSSDAVKRKVREPKFIILSYGLISSIKTEVLSNLKSNVIIVDECHYMKNSSAKRTKALLPLIVNSKRAILLSGTPALSRPMELFTQLHALSPKSWSDEKDFAARYCRSKKRSVTGKVWKGDTKNGHSNVQELHLLLKGTVMIRRLKKDILSQLPPKERVLVTVDVESDGARREMKAILIEISERQKRLDELKRRIKKNRQLHPQFIDDPPNERADISKDQEDAKISNANVTIGEESALKKNLLFSLFIKSGSAKLPGILKEIDKFLSNPANGKLLVFAHHVNVMNGLCNHLNAVNVKHIRIDGTVRSKDRFALTEVFQQSAEHRVAVLAITTAGVAITLTAASTVFFAELFWTPGSLIQAEDRAHRIGQLNAVKVHYFFAKDTIDELLWPLLKSKIKVLGQIMEGKLVVADGKKPGGINGATAANSTRKDSFFTRVVTSSSSSADRGHSMGSSTDVVDESLQTGKAGNISSGDRVIFDLTNSDDEEEEDEEEVEMNPDEGGNTEGTAEQGVPTVDQSAIVEGTEVVSHTKEGDPEESEIPIYTDADAQREIGQLLHEATEEHADEFGLKERAGNESDEEYEDTLAALEDNDDDDSVVFTEAPDPLAVWYLRWRKQLPAIREAGATEAFNSALEQAQKALSNATSSSASNSAGNLTSDVNASSFSGPLPQLKTRSIVPKSSIHPLHYNPNNIFVHRTGNPTSAVSSSTKAILSVLGFKGPSAKPTPSAPRPSTASSSSSSASSHRSLMMPIRTTASYVNTASTNTNINANVSANVSANTYANANSNGSNHTIRTHNPELQNAYSQYRSNISQIRPPQLYNRALAMNNRYLGLPFLSQPAANPQSMTNPLSTTNVLHIRAAETMVPPVVPGPAKEPEIINLADEEDT